MKQKKLTFDEYRVNALNVARNGSFEGVATNLWDADKHFPERIADIYDVWIESARVAMGKDQLDMAEKYLQSAWKYRDASFRDMKSTLAFGADTQRGLGNAWRELATCYGKLKRYDKCLECVQEAVAYGADKSATAETLKTLALSTALAKEFQDATNLIAKLESLEQAVDMYLKVVWLASKAGQIELASKILYRLVDNALPHTDRNTGYYFACSPQTSLSIAGIVEETRTEREKAHEFGLDDWPNLISQEKSGSGLVGLAWDAVREGNFEQARSNMAYAYETLGRISKEDERVRKMVDKRKSLYRKYYFDFARIAKGKESSFEYWAIGYHHSETMREQVEADEIALELGIADLANVDTERLQRMKELAEWEKQNKSHE